MTPLADLEAELVDLERDLNSGPITDMHRYSAMLERRRHLHERIRCSPARVWEEWAPARFRDVRLAPAERPVDATAHAWVDAAMPGNLAVFGPVGVGKTWLMFAAIHEATTRFGLMPGRLGEGGRPDVVAASVAAVLDGLRPDGSVELAELVRPHLLALDDLGAEKATDWTVERLYVAINERWNAQRPTIFTTNLSPDDLKNAVGERVYDRLRDEATVITLKGKSRRAPASASTTEGEP